MKSLSIILILLLGGLGISQAQVNYSEDIAPIIYNNCTSCHRPGEIAPFSLTNYSEVASWGAMIKYVTEIRYMPPWKPDRSYSNFVGEKGLSEAEIQLIADWVDGGLIQGDPSKEPSLPSFPTGSQLGTPDLVLEMAEDYFIEGNNQDDYRVFVLPTGLTENKEIDAIEFRPGNKRAVHHALIAYEVNGQGAAKDAQSPGYGYESFGDFGVPIQGNFSGYTPGIQNIFFPEGIGTTLPKEADLLLQVHYAPLSTNETDRSLLNIFYKKSNDSIQREVQRAPVSPFDLVGGFTTFVIPPDSVIRFHGTKTLPGDVSLISIYPHCHYLGRDWEIYAVTPTNDTINIIRINDWDFNWQGSYTFDRMKKIPNGSVMHIFATYDNTSNNPLNPSFPPQSVTWGEGTTDEMYLVGLTYVPYQTGDENIVLGGSLATDVDNPLAMSVNQLFDPFPNPASSEVALGYSLDKIQPIQVELFDLQGRLLKVLQKEIIQQAGTHLLSFDVEGLAPGLYSIQLSGGDFILSKSLMVAD